MTENTALRDIMLDNLKELKYIECSKCINMQLSDDNIVILNIGKGIHIMKLDCSSTSQEVLRRDYLPAPDKVPLKKMLSSQDNELLWNFDFNSVKEAFCSLESFEFFSKCSPRPIVTYAQLSPLHLKERYLACITNHGALSIYQNLHQEWAEVFDVGSYWLCEACLEAGTPNNWESWKHLMELAKPTAFCWLSLEPMLYFIIALKKGEIVIFSKTTGDYFSLSLRRRMSNNWKDPCFVHAFAIENMIHIIVGYSCGKMAAFSTILEGSEDVLPHCIWEREDYLPPKNIISVSIDNTTYVITSKLNFLLIHSFEPNGGVNVVERNFSGPIKGITLSGKSVHIGFDTGYFVYIALPSGDIKCEIRSSEETCKTVDGFSISPSGFLWIIASPLSWNRCRISFNSIVNGNPSATLDYHLRSGAALTDHLDLLWLLKFSLLENNARGLSENITSDFKKLHYWKLQLKLSHGHDESVAAVLKVIEEELFKSYAEKMSMPSLLSMSDQEEHPSCPLCYSSLIYNNPRVVKCLKGHIWPRCSISFKPCTVAAYAACTMCDAIALLENDPKFPCYQDHVCPFCDGTYQTTHILR